ncbi:hypothetical protein J7337_006158 [Fusarium musae]|uniref:Heterokaryon incompatibility domain-containing protein n=1 Tax=Fusarium musae TaxID=1042133 RepID=A0A9P8DK20_9HYPO|nr:hypothetical protein J7337_006158 [Fusarium musae]KAG9503313.1 hypothetical protein J7337_006158 [Fusarium musae]
MKIHAEALRKLQMELEEWNDTNGGVTQSVAYSEKHVSREAYEEFQNRKTDLQMRIQEEMDKISSFSSTIKKLSDSIGKLKKENKEGDQDIEDIEEDEEEDKDEDEEEDEVGQEMKDQEVRTKKLADLERVILNMRTGARKKNFDELEDMFGILTHLGDPYDILPHRRLDEHLLRHERMLERSSLRQDYYRFRLRRQILMMEQSDSLDESTDTGTQKPVNRKCIQWLERRVSNAQALEECILTLQYYRQKIAGLENLKLVLKSEIFLEQAWLNVMHGSKDIEKMSSAHSQGKSDHLSGRHFPSEKIYTTPLEQHGFRVLILLPAPDPCFPLVCKLDQWSMTEITNAANSGQTPEKNTCTILFLGARQNDEDAPGLDDPSDWGAAVKRATRIRIRNNLFRALLRLRRHGTNDDANANPLAVWVDFLSIHQKDAKEKTEQLGRMVDIYSHASQVCIWLGESDSEGRSDKAMKFIPTIMDFAMLERYARDKTKAEKWYALGELMRDRWFSRRWVVQEMALAKDATVHCGEHVVRWSDFADAASLLVSNQEMIKTLFDFSDWREGQNTLGAVQFFGAWILLESTNNLFRRKPNGEIKKPIKSIEYLVTSLKTFDTGDTRDLIYSLVSIASDTSMNLWNHDSGDNKGEVLVRDYKKSEVAVYQDFTKFCVQSSGSLDVICRPWAMPCQKKLKLPSWIPLLDKSEFGKPEEVYTGRKNGDNLVGPAGSPQYEASGKSKYKPHFERSTAEYADSKDSEAEILVVEGFKLATIHEISPETLMIGWETFRPDSNSVPSEVWRTLVADRDTDSRVAPSWYKRACLRCLEIAHMFNNGDLNVGEILQGPSHMLFKYLKRVQNVTWNRRFFRAHGFEPTRDTDSPLHSGDEDETAIPGKEDTEGGQEEGEETSNGHQEEGEEACIGNPEEGEEASFGNPEEQEEAQDEGTSSNNIRRHESESVVTVENETDKEQTEAPNDGNGDDHTSTRHEAAMEIIDKESERKESGDVKEHDGNSGGEASGQTDENLSDGKFTAEVISEEADNTDVNDIEGNGQVEDNKEVSEELSGQESKDKESAKGQSSDDAGSDDARSDDDGSDDDGNEDDANEDDGSEDDGSEDGGNEDDAIEDDESGDDGSDVHENTESSRGDTATNQDSMTVLGLCPPDTRKGDLICILLGCSVPVVLRETADKKHMTLIGEAYVHGKMDGEAMEDTHRALETFFIE